jgi:glycosyl transferase family 25
MIPCYLINLDRAPARLAFISRRLQALGIPYSRLSAVDGSAMPEKDRTAFIASRPRDGRTWSAGQVGCFMSHVKAWEKIAEGLEPYGVIIEDDVHVSDEAPAFLKSSNWIPADADIVRLESTGQWLKLGKTSSRIDDRAVRRVRSTAWGAGAYVLSKSAALKLLAVEPKLHSPVDDFLFNFKSSAVAKGLTVYQVAPALVEQDKFIANQSASKGFGSDIETGKIFQRVRGISAMLRSVVSVAKGKSPVNFR